MTVLFMTHVFADQSKLSIEQIRNLPIMQSLGQKIFFDTNLSNPPGQACSSCHDPKTAFSDPDLDLPVSRGAVEGKTGTINAPIVMYTAFIPAFHFDPEESLFIGGQFLDGRETTLEEQAKKPFLNPDEMNNPDKASVIQKIRNASYAAEFKLVFGQNVLDDVDKAYDYVASALASFERSAILSPFTSKYDYYLAGAVKLSEQEERGLQLFEAKDKGNCAACHPTRPIDGKLPLFTDFTYDNLGIPSNQKILEAKGADFVDIGLGKIVKEDTDNGKFRVPTLRNTAKTAPYSN
ncbi:cytochrome-c peroxidase [Nitrosomonas sp. Is37]|uniref:cytochrome-c peroxidase n=1 Tax=Nitrosomonas sp. Is37 TaxID=3080535 RepID=UPI00294B2A09|nr:cytochrome c peroxidase [Nitrosomonas sp. Is37]MDV6345017.1 cytochrome c peroxidase [Nitrosomonas sp. Is37]